jgi:hypothetical protein
LSFFNDIFLDAEHGGVISSGQAQSVLSHIKWATRKATLASSLASNKFQHLKILQYTSFESEKKSENMRAALVFLRRQEDDSTVTLQTLRMIKQNVMVCTTGARN